MLRGPSPAQLDLKVVQAPDERTLASIVLALSIPAVLSSTQSDPSERDRTPMPVRREKCQYSLRCFRRLC